MVNPTACVTGASGMVGSRICQLLLQRGYPVRALSRTEIGLQGRIQWFTGDITNVADMQAFTSGAELVFHCAAELRDESKMWDVNAGATENLVKCIANSGVKYFCHLSSVGVIGDTALKLVDECAPCAPKNTYEKSKWAAEQSATRVISGCRTVILRPTNVVDESWPGILALPHRRGLADLIKAFVKGGECVHLVHAEDVAEVAIYLMDHPADGPQVYLISCDDEPSNTLAGVWALYDAMRKKSSSDCIRYFPHLPLWVPYLLRRIVRRGGNMGDVRYSSDKLLKTGFVFKMGLRGLIERIAASQEKR